MFNIKVRDIKGGVSAHDMRQIHHQIMDLLSEKLTISSLAKSVNLSPFYFAKMFKISFGESPAQFINWQRIQRDKQLLKTKQSLSEISLNIGFSHQSFMRQSFKAQTGVTPAKYRALAAT